MNPFKAWDESEAPQGMSQEEATVSSIGKFVALLLADQGSTSALDRDYANLARH